MGPGDTASRLLNRLTATQLAAAIAVLAALALGGSLAVTGYAIRQDQREKAALAALQDYTTMVAKLGDENTFQAETLAETDAAWLSAWLSAFQEGPGRAGTIEQACREGRGGAGVRLIRAPNAKPAGLAALASAPSERLERLGDDVYLLRLAEGDLCPRRAIEVVAVDRPVAGLEVIVGRVVERPGAAWGWAVLAVGVTGALILVSGLAAALLARRRFSAALEVLTHSLDRAAVGDFEHRASQATVPPELRDLTQHVNTTLDRLKELLGWLRDSSDQLAHDFRTPLARAAARLDGIADADDASDRARLIGEARGDIEVLTRAMKEALSLRDGEAWMFESVRLDELAAASAELYQPLAEDRGIALETDLEAVSILGVRSLLQRAMANLVDNAVKFSPDGGVVRIRVWTEEGRAAFCVADQGPGVDPGLLDDPRLRRPVEGKESHGMGLPFVRAIVRRHGGELMIEDARPGAIVTARF